MGFQSNLQGQEGAVALRVVVRTPDLHTFIRKYSRFIRDDRIFIFTKSSQPIGTRVRFTLEFADGNALLNGDGTVTRLREETGDPSKPPGMELRFRPIDEPSARIVEFMLAERATQEAAKKNPVSPTVLPVPEPPMPRQKRTAAPPPVLTPLSVSPLSPSPPPASDPTPPSASSDEIAHNFPTVDPPPAFIESFRPALSDGLVPANPFSEVSDGAIEYFVEWSLERSTVPHETEAPAQASFGNVKMVRPSIEMEVPTLARQPRSRLPSLLIGLGLGLTLGVAGPFFWSRRTSPSAAAPPLVSQEAEGRLNPPTPPAKPEEKPRPAPEAAAPVAAASAARMAVTSRPPGATVLIDGKELGHTPLKAQVSAGHHQLELVLDRYANADQSIEAPGSIDVVMKRPHATLTVESSPTGAEVLIAGERRGHAPVTIGLSAFENYDVQVQFAGGRHWKRRVYVKTPATKVLAQAAPQSTTPPRGRPTGIR